jgi:hypothetical protein
VYVVILPFKLMILTQVICRPWGYSRHYTRGITTSLSFHRKLSPHLRPSFHVCHLFESHMLAFLLYLFHALKAAAVGTVQIRSLIEPIRKIIARLRGHFVQGKAVDLCMSERLIEVETASTTNGDKTNVYIPCVSQKMPRHDYLLTSYFSYDKLIIAVGSSSSTHGVPGLQHCFQLKTIADAQAIRRRIMGTSQRSLGEFTLTEILGRQFRGSQPTNYFARRPEATA